MWLNRGRTKGGAWARGCNLATSIKICSLLGHCLHFGSVRWAKKVFIVGIGLRESAWFSGDSNSTPGVVCLHCDNKGSCSSPGGLVCKALLLQGPKVTERKNKDDGLPLRFLLNEGGKCWVFILLLVTLWTQVRSPYFFFSQLLSACFHLLERKERPLGWETAWHLDSPASYRQWEGTCQRCQQAVYISREMSRFFTHTDNGRLILQSVNDKEQSPPRDRF